MTRNVAPVSDAAKYPNEWARLIDGLASRPKWSKTRLAKELDVDRRTIHRYIDGESVNVSAMIMNSVAILSGRPLQEISDLVTGAQARAAAEDDQMVRDILADPDAPDYVKQQAIAHVRARRRENEEILRRDIDVLLNTHRPQTEG